MIIRLQSEYHKGREESRSSSASKNKKIIGRVSETESKLQAANWHPTLQTTVLSLHCVRICQKNFYSGRGRCLQGMEQRFTQHFGRGGTFKLLSLDLDILRTWNAYDRGLRSYCSNKGQRKLNSQPKSSPSTFRLSA